MPIVVVIDCTVNKQLKQEFQTVLYTLICGVAQSLEEHGSVACVFFDLSKAFDTLPHSLILDLLIRVGVPGALFKWFVDYLSDRRQSLME